MWIIVASLLPIIIILAIKLYANMTLGVCYSERNMEGKTILITGANSGIGRETAMDLAKRGARVIMACRNIETATQARDEIVKETKNDNVVVKKVDLSSLSSVRALGDDINKSEERLDVLIHNAGVANAFSKHVTQDGLELTMATNQFGPFLLTHLLIDKLMACKPSRIVVVSSELYRLAKVDLENPNPVNAWPAYLYYVSKYANLLFALELARRTKNKGVTVNALHPGLVDSGIWRNVPFPLNLPLKLLSKAFFKTVEEGAQTTIFCAVSQEVEGITGKYFIDCKEHGISEGAQDAEKGRNYWKICEEIVKLQPGDPKIEPA